MSREESYEELLKERDDLKYEVMQLRTENNDMTTAVTKTMKILYDEYYYGDLPMHNHDKIYNALKDADL